MLCCARRKVRSQVPSVQGEDGGVFDGCCQYYNLTRMTIELTRKHAVLFTVLLAIQTWGFSRSPVLAHLPAFIWAMLPGSAFLNTVIIVEMLRVLTKNR